MQTTSNIPKLHSLIEGIQFAMLTTTDAEGHLRSRPMSTIDVDSNSELWFFTRSNSEKSHEVERDQRVNVSYADPDQQSYVSVSGRAELVRDRQKMESLWNPTYKTWFPRGLDDPELTLIRVEIEQAEFWDASSSRMVRTLADLGALATGSRQSATENKKVNVS